MARTTDLLRSLGGGSRSGVTGADGGRAAAETAPRRRGYVPAAAALLAVTLLGTAACGPATASSTTSGGAASTPTPTSAPAAAASQPHVTIGYEDAPDPEMVAIADHYFSKYMHAHVTMKYYSSGPAALASLASGSLQFMTVLGNPPLATAIAKGVPLQVIWAQDLYTTGEGLVVKTSSHITKLSQLEGHRVALASGSTSSFELATAEKQAGIPAGKIRIDNMTPPAMVAAWKSGAIKAAWVWVPFFSDMLHAGGSALLYDKSQGPAAPVFNLAVVNSTWAKTHAALVQGFVQAEAAGVATYQKHPHQAYQAMAKVGAITAAQAQSQAKGLKFLTLQDQLTAGGLGAPGQTAHSLVTKSLTAAAIWLKASGRASTVPSNFAAFVNPSYAAAVAKGGGAG